MFAQGYNSYSISHTIPLQLRHDERDGVPNLRCLRCLLHCCFRRRSKKISKFRVTGLCERWIPRTNGQQRGKCFHLMTSSWKSLPRATAPIVYPTWFDRIYPSPTLSFTSHLKLIPSSRGGSTRHQGFPVSNMLPRERMTTGFITEIWYRL